MSAGVSASAFTAQDANVLFNAYSNAYYSLSGSNGYFKNLPTGGIADFWKQAEEIECIIDAYEWAPNPGRKVMITQLLNGFADKHGTNWLSNQYNDDCFWACIAFARGYQNTGLGRFRDAACWNFDRVYARSWDDALGGGLYWTTTNLSKNACVNGPGGIAAALLYRICGDTGYLTKASNIFRWERAVLFNADSGAVADSIGVDGRLHRWASTYNQGTFIGLANFLGQTNDAVLAANYTRDTLAVSGLLPRYGAGGNNSGFNAIFLRWMARFVRDRGLVATYEPWLQDNANAAWNVRRSSDNLSWCQWQRPTPEDRRLRSWDCIASVEALAVVQPSSPAAAGLDQPKARANKE
ncbi:MAG TPA: glycoside hydrolase family 76 protein [Verrucomicrobiae bacterium]|nr:glycoside hydrolase family 76 protein [Verrucomicrobiae bacterium]